jgi:hypothetical protein
MFVFCVMLCRLLFVPLSSFFRLAIVVSILFWFMASDYPFGIFKLFLPEWLDCLFFIYDLYLLVYFWIHFLNTFIRLYENSKCNTCISYLLIYVVVYIPSMEINMKRGMRRKNTVTEMVSIRIKYPYIFINVSMQLILRFQWLNYSLLIYL